MLIFNLILGKRIFYGSRGSYKVRVEAAALAFNTKRFMDVVNAKLYPNQQPGKCNFSNVMSSRCVGEMVTGIVKIRVSRNFVKYM